MRHLTESQVTDLVYDESEEGEIVHREFNGTFRLYLLY